MYIYKSVKQDIFGMARVGSTSDKYEIYVNTNDGGKFPHFHYRVIEMLKIGRSFILVFESMWQNIFSMKGRKIS